MPINVYQKCVKMLEEHKGKELNLDELKGLICIHCGSQQITIDTALKTMGMTNLIKDMGNMKFKIV